MQRSGSREPIRRNQATAAPRRRARYTVIGGWNTRERWADLTNKTLERVGHEERVDHRSYSRQGIDQEAGRHFGPAAAHMVSRGGSHDRLEVAATHASDQQRLEAVDRAIADLETERQAFIASEQKRVEL